MTPPKSRWTNERTPAPQGQAEPPRANILGKLRAMPVGYQILILLGILFWAGLLFSPRRTTETATSPSPSPAVDDRPIAGLDVEVNHESPLQFYYVVGTVTATKKCRLLTIHFLWQKDGVRVAENIAQFSDVSPGNVLAIRELYRSEQYPDRYLSRYSCF